MKRTKAREIAVQISFAASNSGQKANELCEYYLSEQYIKTNENAIFDELPDEKQREYINKLTEYVSENSDKLDEIIETYSKGWKINRISKMAKEILRCSLAEILYIDDVPDGVAVNEAVNLAKKYDDPSVASFVNGILGRYLKDKMETDTTNE